MEFTELRDGKVVVVIPNGRIDAATAEEFQKRLLAIIGDQPIRLALDCTEIRYISSIGLRALIVAAKKVAAVRGRLVVCAVPRHVQQIFDLAGIATVITILGTRQEAIDAIAK
jgi:stage II sporulation protein AA (anti-sigma F factor antagonist)